MPENLSTITLGELGDVVEIDISMIGSVRGYKLMERAGGERNPSYFSDLILIAAEGHVTPHEIDAEWLEENVSFPHALEACEAINRRATEKNTPSPVKST